MKDKPKWPLRRIVEVDWLDATSRGRWKSVDEQRKETVPTVCRTVGYLLVSDRHRVSVAQSQGTGGDATDTITIPRGMVQRMRTIGKVR